VGLTTEHLLFSHPSLPLILSKLFDLIVLSQQIPAGFRYSYIVPVPKPKDCRTKTMRCDDFGDIAISPVLSKLFKHCFLDRFQSLLLSGDNQFGFKKALAAVMQFTLQPKIAKKSIKPPILVFKVIQGH